MNKKYKILAVDDEPRNLKILTLGLGDEWEVKTAPNGEEALALMDEYNPDVILLDIMMPGIDGYEVCKRIKANAKFELTKVILVSGKAMLEERIKGYECGSDDYVTKPFVPEELNAKIRVFLRLIDTEQKLRILNQSLEQKVEERTRKLLEAEGRLIQSAKMSALGEMAGGIAHEINTPLAALVLFSSQIGDLLNEEPTDKEMIKSIVEKVEKTTLNISRIIQGLRTFSRDSHRDGFARASIKEIIEGTLGLCGEKMRKNGISVTYDVSKENLDLDCRASQISQVLLNLIQNSFDAIEVLPEKWVKIKATQDASDLCITVTDSGLGLSKEIADKIFQPFFTTKDVGKGTGLGLSISQGLIESHGGTIKVDEKSPHTSFVIRIPLQQGKQ